MLTPDPAGLDGVVPAGSFRQAAIPLQDSGGSICRVSAADRPAFQRQILPRYRINNGCTVFYRREYIDKKGRISGCPHATAGQSGTLRALSPAGPSKWKAKSNGMKNKLPDDLTNKDKFSSRQSGFHWRTLLWALAIWFLVLYLFNGFSRQPQEVETLSYSAFKDQVRQGKVAEVTIKGNEIRGRFESPAEKAEEKNAAAGESPGRNSSKSESSARNGQPQKGDTAKNEPDRFKTVMPDMRDPDLLPLLENNDVIISAETTGRSWIWTVLITLLPWLLIIGFFVWSSRKFQQRMGGGGGGGGIFGFSKSKAKLYDRSKSDVTYEDVAGLKNAKKELREVVGFLKDPSKFTSLGGELPNGILLVGPPGCGKTLLARACAGEADVPFFSISGSEFIEMFVGVGASRVRDMFKKAKKESPAIIFIDEIDSIGRTRGTGVGGGHDEREQTLNQILNEMDGFEPHESVVVMAATNRPDVLDPALVRPGRFDRRITLELPQKKARRQILEIHTRDVPLADDVDMETLAERTVGLSGADLKNLTNEASLLAARKGKDKVEAEDFDQARDKILLGLEREEVLRDEEKETIAYHEAGHAVLAELLPEADSLQKVTIIPRGRALGATEQIPEEDRHNLRRSYLLARIAVLVGGRASEKLVFDDISTGAADDLKKATQMARRMVCQWGMSDRVGPVTFKTGEPHPFLGRELSEPKDYSEHTAQIIDEEVQQIVLDMQEKAKDILTSNRETLDRLAEYLLENETAYREDLDEIFAAGQQKEAAN